MIIQLPFVPGDLKQAEAVLGILKTLPSHIKPGVQIFRGPVDIHEQIPDDALVEYVNKTFPAEYVKTLHAPISDDNPDPRYSLAHPESEEMVLSNLRVAERIGARSVTLHTNTVFTQGGDNPWTDEMNDYRTMARRVREPVYHRLDKLADDANVKIGVENMPLPIRGNHESKLDPSRILFEPLMNSQDDLRFFCMYSAIMPFLGLTYDTSHAEIARRVLNELRAYRINTPDDLMQTPYRGVYPGHFDIQPSVKHGIAELLRLGKVIDVQLADTKGRWIPNNSTAQEGVVLGDGDLGEDIFEIARLINRDYSSVPVSIDVAEEDYIARPRQRESLRRLLSWLG